MTGNRYKRTEQGEFSGAEARIVAVTITGITSREVGEKLFVTEKTVKFHLTNIYKKLKVKSKPELIARWHTKSLPQTYVESVFHYCPELRPHEPDPEPPMYNSDLPTGL